MKPTRRKLCMLVFVAAGAFFGSHKQAALPEVDADAADRWQLVWSDEFNYSGLPDPVKWGYDVGGQGWGNKELQYYSERRKENAPVGIVFQLIIAPGLAPNIVSPLHRIRQPTVIELV